MVKKINTVLMDVGPLISIDGVVIVPSDDYTVSGTTLTLTFMPPAGLIVEARKLA